MEAVLRRFNTLYPNPADLHALLTLADSGADVKGLHGTYIRNMGKSGSKPGCITYFISSSQYFRSADYKVRRCPDNSLEIKSFNGAEWIPYGAVRTPPRLHPAHRRERSRSRSRGRRHRSRSGSTRRSGSTHSRSGSANSR